MTDKINETSAETGERVSRRVALQKLGLGTAAFIVPLVTTVSEAKALDDTPPDPDPKPEKSNKSGWSAPNEWSKLIVNAWLASGLSGRWFPAPEGGSPERYVA